MSRYPFPYDGPDYCPDCWHDHEHIIEPEVHIMVENELMWLCNECAKLWISENPGSYYCNKKGEKINEQV
jgi:hypothetical protein